MSTRLDIDGRPVGADGPVYVIAEGCDNHLGDMDKAHQMIERAHASGADAIKFQHHLPDEEMLRDVPMSDNFDEPLYDFLLTHALTLDQHRELMTHAHEVGITYLCTPFSLRAAEELETLGLPAYKIGSGEMTDLPTLERIADFGKPMIVSTGMATWEEIDKTYGLLASKNVPLILTNCVSEYPPIYEDMNLNVIPQMIGRYPKATIGHSDHTPDLFTSFAAVSLGARVIEKHVILDKQQPGPDQSVSIDFDDLAELVDGVRKVDKALGQTKKVHAKEASIREWAFRSVVTIAPIRTGERLSLDNIWSKRPGTGIPASQMDEVLGGTALRDLPPNHLLVWDDFKRDE